MSHPAVTQAAVVGLPDADLGQVVAAAVCLTVPDGATETELVAFASQHLAHFAVPQRWWFLDGQIPLNDAGKVLKTSLAANWPAPIAGGDAFAPGTAKS